MCSLHKVLVLGHCVCVCVCMSSSVLYCRRVKNCYLYNVILFNKVNTVCYEYDIFEYSDVLARDTFISKPVCYLSYETSTYIIYVFPIAVMTHVNLCVI